MSKTLDELTPPEQAQLTSDALFTLRQECYERLAGAMVTPAIAEWAANMEIKHGDAKCRVHFNHPLTWAAALAVVRYGEEPRFADDGVQWPAQFTAEDLQRAQAWLAGTSVPMGVTTL